MCFRANRNINCRGLRDHDIRSFIPLIGEPSSSLHIRIKSGPSRRTQKSSKDNATLRLDSSLEAPTVNPPAVCSGSAQQTSCLSARIAKSLEVDL